jgi:hypothetical protein
MIFFGQIYNILKAYKNSTTHEAPKHVSTYLLFFPTTLHRFIEFIFFQKNSSQPLEK